MFRPVALLAIWLPVVVVTILHYSTGPELRWVHDVLRRVYYLPILAGAFLAGLRGGLVVSVPVSLAYLPHAFMSMHRPDPAHGLEKILELLFYNVIAVVAGLLADRAESRRRQAELAARQLREALAEQHRTARQLERAGRMAALGQMVAGIAHEIRNPLHTIKGAVEILDPVIPRDAEEARMWDLLKRELERMGRISERFLTFAAPRERVSVRVDLGKLLERCVGLVDAQARKGGVSVVLDPVEAVAPVWVEGDPDLLLQAVLNVVLNGLQAMESKGGNLRLGLGRRVGTDEGSGWVLVDVENDGPSIPEEDLDRVFEPFFSRRTGGSGLGLAITRRIVEDHLGSLSARNTGEARGVRFEVVLPGAAEG